MKKIPTPIYHQVSIEIRCPRFPCAKSTLKRFTEDVLRQLKKDGYGVSVFVVDSGRMKALHLKHFNDPSDTDCISFSQYEGRQGGDSRLLGDVFVCWNQVKRQSTRFGNTPREELLYCILHGILHLLGYDDLSPVKKKKMFKIQDLIFRNLSVRRFNSRTGQYGNTKNRRNHS